MLRKILLILFIFMVIIISTKPSFTQNTSDNFFKLNAGKILFSKTNFDINKLNVKNFVIAFQPDDNIYGLLILKDSLKNILSGGVKLDENIYIDSALKLNFNVAINDSLRSMYYIPIEILPDPQASNSNETMYIAHDFATLTNEKHIIKINFINSKTKDFIASGEFELDCTKGVGKIEALANILLYKRLSGVEMPASKWNNPELEKEMLSCFQDWVDKPLKIVITDYDWNYVKDQWNNMQYRFVNAVVAVKNKYGKCKIYNISFKQDFDVHDFGKTVRFIIGSSQEILCDNVK